MLSRVSTALSDSCFSFISLSFRLVMDMVHRRSGLSSSAPMPDQSSVVPSSEEDGTGWPPARGPEWPEEVLGSLSWTMGAGTGGGNAIGEKVGRDGEVLAGEGLEATGSDLLDEGLEFTDFRRASRLAFSFNARCTSSRIRGSKKSLITAGQASWWACLGELECRYKDQSYEKYKRHPQRSYSSEKTESSITELMTSRCEEVCEGPKLVLTGLLGRPWLGNDGPGFTE